jgi:pimeloyl-ACP methyl ester carboxylesterase
MARNVPSLSFVDQVMKLHLIIFSLSLGFFNISVYGNPIHEAQAIKAGSILQWIKIDGVNDQSPVLLFLHGGPGNSAMNYSNRFTEALQKKFVVVQWDQRETGKTKSLNSSHEPLTVMRFDSDAVDVINYLRSKFNQDKIYLVGHSWGGFLAIEVASRHPELLTACFAAAPMVDQLHSERLALNKMMEVATKAGNTNAVEELSQVKVPFENGRQLYFHRKWLHTLLHHEQVRMKQGYVENWAKVWLALFNEASAINFEMGAPEIKCPIYFMVGAHDYQTNYELTKTYFEKLKAPKKELFWFNDSAHLLNLTESRKFQDVIISTSKSLK